nr:ParA family protein [Micromonospora globbae]
MDQEVRVTDATRSETAPRPAGPPSAESAAPSATASAEVGADATASPATSAAGANGVTSTPAASATAVRAGESPWAYPPQRTSADSGTTAATPTGSADATDAPHADATGTTDMTGTTGAPGTTGHEASGGPAVSPPLTGPGVSSGLTGPPLSPGVPTPPGAPGTADGPPWPHLPGAPAVPATPPGAQPHLVEHGHPGPPHPAAQAHPSTQIPLAAHAEATPPLPTAHLQPATQAQLTSQAQPAAHVPPDVPPPHLVPPPSQAATAPTTQPGHPAPQLAGPVPPADVPALPPPGPFPPGWTPPAWQRAAAAGAGQPYQPQTAPTGGPGYPPASGYPPPTGYPPAAGVPEPGESPTAEDFARRRQARPAEPVATMGVRAVANKLGLRLPPGRHEQELRRDIEMVRRNFGGLRQVTVVNPKGGAGKTVAILLLAMTFGQKRGGYVLAWDNNETQGTLGMRAQQDFHSRTVRDLLRDLGQFQGAHGRVGDLSQYVRSQGEGMFDVLASDESATGGEMLTAAAFAELREVVSRFYKLIFVDTGNNVRAQNWQAAMDATDQLVVTMSARNDSAETAARMLDHLEQSGRQRLVRQAVTVVSMPPSRKDINLPAIQRHFAARTRAVLLAPYERLIDSGEPIRYGALSTATRDAWLKIAAAVAEGL